MHWKDTVIKQIKWARPKLTQPKDGKLDFHFHLRLTGMFESQAKPAFAQGMLTMLSFHMNAQTDRAITTLDLAQLFEESGLPEIAAKFREASPEPAEGNKNGS